MNKGDIFVLSTNLVNTGLYRRVFQRQTSQCILYLKFDKCFVRHSVGCLGRVVLWVTDGLRSVRESSIFRENSVSASFVTAYSHRQYFIIFKADILDVKSGDQPSHFEAGLVWASVQSSTTVQAYDNESVWQVSVRQILLSCA